MKWMKLGSMAALLAAGVSPLAGATVSVQEQSRTATNQAGEVRTESVQQVATPTGGLVPWRQDSVVSRPTQPGVTETTHEIKQRDLKGALRVEARQTSITTKTPTGANTQSRQYARDAAGNLVLHLVTDEVTQQTATGSVATGLERVPDINGELVRRREIQSETKALSPHEQTSETRVRAFDPVAGVFRLTSIETTRTKQEGNTTQAETVTREPGNDAGPGRLVARKLTTSQAQAGGVVQRETIEYGLSQHARSSAFDRDELVAQQKTVDRIVRQPDGTTSLQREFYRRDVNNEWKPITVYPSASTPQF